MSDPSRHNFRLALPCLGRGWPPIGLNSEGAVPAHLKPLSEEVS